jgi:hypothetical protein
MVKYGHHIISKMMTAVISFVIVTNVPAMSIIEDKAIAVPDVTMIQCNVNKTRIIGYITLVLNWTHQMVTPASTGAFGL